MRSSSAISDDRLLKPINAAKNSLTDARRGYRSFIFSLLFIAALAWFSDGAAQGQTEPGKLLTVWAGALPIILSAPHGGRQPIPRVSQRRGIGVKQFVAERDANTDELAERVAVKLTEQFSAKPFLVIAHFERKFIDVNRSRETAYEALEAKPYYDGYHRALREACERMRGEWGYGLLVDIHGQGAQVDAIYRGTNDGKTVASLTERFGREAVSGSNSIFGQLEQKGYKVFPPTDKPYKENRNYIGGYIVQTYGSHQGTGIDAIQLEFGTNLRRRSALERTAADLADAIVVFARQYLPAVKLSIGKAINMLT